MWFEICECKVKNSHTYEFIDDVCDFFKFCCAGCYQFLFSKYEHWNHKLPPTSQKAWWMHLV